jgi:hypothetical protein
MLWQLGWGFATESHAGHQIERNVMEGTCHGIIVSADGEGATESAASH